MRDYEMMLILRPELDEEGVRAMQTRIEDSFARYGGNVLRTTVWGRRKLAYPLTNARLGGYRAREGYYIIYNLSLPPRAAASIDRDFRLMEDILRFLNITRDDQTLAASIAEAATDDAIPEPSETSEPQAEETAPVADDTVATGEQEPAEFAEPTA